MPLDNQTLERIRTALGSINTKYGTKLDAVRVSKLAPLLSFERPPLEAVFKIPLSFAAVYRLATGKSLQQTPSDVTVRAVTAAEVSTPDDRKIYFSTVPEYGTVVHELFHWLCHRDFFQQFHLIGTNVGKADEGMTEYLTRTMEGVGNRHGVYDDEVSEVRDRFTLEPMSPDGAKALWTYFQGGNENIEWFKDRLKQLRRQAVALALSPPQSGARPAPHSAAGKSPR